MMGWSIVASSPSIRATWAGRGGASKGRSGGDARCAAPAADGSLVDQYRTLRVQPGASAKEVKKAFRKLALQYHPDVCKGSHCSVQFQHINEAYDIVIRSLRKAEEEQEQWQPAEWGEGGYTGDEDDDQMWGMYDPSWDSWEEWMGWEGAGTGDYTSHINPYL